MVDGLELLSCARAEERLAAAAAMQLGAPAHAMGTTAAALAGLGRLAAAGFPAAHENHGPGGLVRLPDGIAGSGSAGSSALASSAPVPTEGEAALLATGALFLFVVIVTFVIIIIIVVVVVFAVLFVFAILLVSFVFFVVLLADIERRPARGRLLSALGRQALPLVRLVLAGAALPALSAVIILVLVLVITILK